jgi:hypothetical protein
MSRIVPEIWTRLAGERVQGETLWARRAAPEVTERLVAALDADGKRHFLVLLRVGEADMQDSQSRGVAVVTRELLMPGHQAGRYLDIACHDAAGHDAFDLIGGELADRLVSGRETSTECVIRVLAKWRRFWGQLPLHMLSREEQLGLLAEIWFLSVWLLPKAGPAEALRRWRGPFASRHDFAGVAGLAQTLFCTSSASLRHSNRYLSGVRPARARDFGGADDIGQPAARRVVAALGGQGNNATVLFLSGALAIVPSLRHTLSSVVMFQEIKDSLHRPYVEDPRSWLVGFGGGKACLELVEGTAPCWPR